jgi:hypothetical protein
MAPAREPFLSRRCVALFSFIPLFSFLSSFHTGAAFFMPGFQK